MGSIRLETVVASQSGLDGGPSGDGLALDLDLGASRADREPGSDIWNCFIGLFLSLRAGVGAGQSKREAYQGLAGYYASALEIIVAVIGIISRRRAHPCRGLLSGGQYLGWVFLQGGLRVHQRMGSLCVLV